MFKSHRAMRPVHPDDTGYRRYVRFYAPKARGEYDFRLYDEVDPYEALGPDADPDDPDAGGANFMLMGWSKPLKVEVQGRDLGPVLERCAEFLREAGARLVRAANNSLRQAMRERVASKSKLAADEAASNRDGGAGGSSRGEWLPYLQSLSEWAAKVLGPAEYPEVKAWILGAGAQEDGSTSADGPLPLPSATSEGSDVDRRAAQGAPRERGGPTAAAPSETAGGSASGMHSETLSDTAGWGKALSAAGQLRTLIALVRVVAVSPKLGEAWQRALWAAVQLAACCRAALAVQHQVIPAIAADSGIASSRLEEDAKSHALEARSWLVATMRGRRSVQPEAAASSVAEWIGAVREALKEVS